MRIYNWILSVSNWWDAGTKNFLRLGLPEPRTLILQISVTNGCISLGVNTFQSSDCLKAVLCSIRMKRSATVAAEFRRPTRFRSFPLCRHDRRYKFRVP